MLRAYADSQKKLMNLVTVYYIVWWITQDFVRQWYEFKNKLFLQVASTLEKKEVFSCPHYPRGKSRTEHLHNFLKMCIWKHVSPEPAWEAVVHMACSAYNFLPNDHSKESEFFFMFGSDAYILLVQLLKPKPRYLGNNNSLLALGAFKNIYALAIHNITLSRERQADKFPTYPMPEFNVEDKVLVRNHTKHV